MINTRKHTALFIIIIAISCCSILPKNATVQRLDLSLPKVERKNHKARMRKSSGTPVKKIYSYRDMEYEDLVVAKDKLVAQNNTISAIKYLEQLIKLCNSEDADRIAAHRLEIADLFFVQENFHKASQKYAEFALLHPGNKDLAYALYKAIVSADNCTLTYDRDQSKTEETLALAESFLKQDHFSQYADEVAAIADKCRSKLIESELSVCLFHVNRGSFKAAEKRLAYLRNHWLPKKETIESQIVALENDIATRKQLIIQKNNKQLLVAQNNAKSMTERF